MQLFVVPKSIPSTFAIFFFSLSVQHLLRARREKESRGHAIWQKHLNAAC
jgi:hypothetical protein